MKFQIRPISPKDNFKIKQIVQTVLAEFGCIGPGFASNDQELNSMYESYQQNGAGYFVVEDLLTHDILGGGGFATLSGTSHEEKICELRKLYFLSTIRGYGLGTKLMEKIFQEAKTLGYQEMYLETVPQLRTAIMLYEKLGFKKLNSHKGNTGHQNACNLYMSKILNV